MDDGIHVGIAVELMMKNLLVTMLDKQLKLMTE
jgi:hypothetical protein